LYVYGEYNTSSNALLSHNSNLQTESNTKAKSFVMFLRSSLLSCLVAVSFLHPHLAEAVFCSAGPDDIDIDAYATKSYSCSGTPNGQTRIVWETVNGIEGFNEDEYFINVVLSNYRYYRSGQWDDPGGGESGLLGPEDGAESGWSVEFECNLGTWFLSYPPAPHS
jgi:hypothetical protein